MIMFWIFIYKAMPGALLMHCSCSLCKSYGVDLIAPSSFILEMRIMRLMRAMQLALNHTANKVAEPGFKLRPVWVAPSGTDDYFSVSCLSFLWTSGLQGPMPLYCSVTTHSYNWEPINRKTDSSKTMFIIYLKRGFCFCFVLVYLSWISPKSKTSKSVLVLC